MQMSLVDYYYFNKVGEFCLSLYPVTFFLGYLRSPLYFISANH